MRTWHRPTYHPANPILRPERPWEQRDDSPSAPNSASQSGGDGVQRRRVLRSAGSRCSRCGTWAATACRTCLADLRRRHQLAAADASTSCPAPTSSTTQHRDSSTVWLDLHESDPRAALQDVAVVRPRARAADVAGRHSLDGDRRRPGRPAIARRSSTTRSATSGSSACAPNQYRASDQRPLPPLLGNRRLRGGARRGRPLHRWRGSRPTRGLRGAGDARRGPSSTTSIASPTKA